MTTPDAATKPTGPTGPTEPTTLVTVLLVSAVLAEMWLRSRFMFGTALLSLAALLEALSAQRAEWVVVAAVALGGAATAFFGPMLRPWRPSRIWLIMLSTSAYAAGVILVLAPP